MAAITDKFSKVINGTTRPVATTLASQKVSGATSATLVATTGWDTGTAVHGIMYRTNASNVKINGSQIDWKATISGTTLNNFTVTAGSDDTYEVGTVVMLSPTAAWGDDLVTGLLVEHNQDGTHSAVTATSVTASAVVQGASVISTGDIQHRSVSLETIRGELLRDYVASGCVITGTGYGSTLAWSMTSGVVYIAGRRLTVASASGTVTASKDTYFDVLDPGSGTVGTLVNTSGNIVNNNAASPALAASSIRIGIVVSGASNIANVAAINQGQNDRVLPIASSVPYCVTDSLGNLICPRDPQSRIIGYRQVTTSQNTTSTSVVQLTGLAAPIIASTSPRKVVIKLYAPGTQNNTANTSNDYEVWDGTVGSGTRLGAFSWVQPSGATGMRVPCVLTSPPVTLSAGSHTINAGFLVSGGTATFNSTGSTGAYVQVELA